MAAASGPSAKRLRRDGGSGGAELPSPLNGELFTPASRAALRSAYAAAQPYPHAVLRPLCDDARLRAAFAEMRDELTGTFKETDLFKLYQTGDLGAMDASNAALAARVPQLLALRAAIYSEAFRDFVCDVTGCGPLSERTDCSCNLYVRGSHLLCHDDVIGTRRVSYIIYLTEPDEGWERSDGGALELYPLAEAGRAGEPAAKPCSALLPLWNSMTMFTVLPGRSFHAVEEVFAERKLRLSISGWFHAADAPADASLASLAQLTAPGGADDAAAPFSALPLPPPPPGAADEAALAPPALTAEETALLAAWVSGEYLLPEAQARVRKRFVRDNSVQLRGFLRADRAAALAAAAAAADAAAALGGGAPPPSHNAGCSAGWRVVGPPHKQRFLQYDAAAAPPPPPPQPLLHADAAAAAERAGALLSQAASALFASSAFGKLLWLLTALRATSVRSASRRFRPGLDYTVAHHGVLTRAPRLDATLVAAAHHGSGGDCAEAEAWRSGEVGGFEAYLAADESPEGKQAADVYRVDAAAADDEAGLLSVSAAPNTLSLVHRDEGIMRFVRYVSASAPGSRWDVSAEYEVLVPEGSSDDEEEDEEEEEEEGAEEEEDDE